MSSFFGVGGSNDDDDDDKDGGEASNEEAAKGGEENGAARPGEKRQQQQGHQNKQQKQEGLADLEGIVEEGPAPSFWEVSQPNQPLSYFFSFCHTVWRIPLHFFFCRVCY
jgi:hypothetical protein